MSTAAGDDRRVYTRMPLVRGCKLLDQKSAKFVPAETANVSQGGLLLRAPATRPFAAGDRVEVAVGWGNVPIAASVKMAGGVVVRVMDIDHVHQALAVRFDHAEAVEEPAETLEERFDDAVEDEEDAVSLPRAA